MRFLSPDITDLDIAAACCRCEPQAQRMLFERTKRRMFGICLRFSDSRQDAEDLLQEGFIIVFQEICQFRGEGSLEGWVRRIFVRTAIKYLKKRQKLSDFDDTSVLQNFWIENEDFDTEAPDQLLQLMQQLPQGFRAVLNLYVLENKSHDEIAAELGITASTSRSQLARAKAFMRRLMDKMTICL